MSAIRPPTPTRTVTLSVRDTGEPVEVTPARLLVAGYTGRDETSLRRHIEELARAGVAPPASVPTFYEVDLGMLTFADVIAVDGDETSGEAEPVLLRTPSGWYVSVGSDHTDRGLERESVELSKRRCPKVASSEVLPLERLRPCWDTLRLRGFADGVLHQDAPLADILPIDELLAETRQRTGADTEGLVLFMGTVPSLDGEHRFATSYACELAAEDGEILLSHSYRLERGA